MKPDKPFPTARPEPTLGPMATAVLLNGCRWANNILVELLGNYSSQLRPSLTSKLREATRQLQNACDELRSL